MILMMILIMFSQLSMEIYVYGFMVNQQNLKVAENKTKSEKKEQYNKSTKDKTEALKNKESVFCLAKPIKGGVSTSCFGDKIDRSVAHVGHDWAVEIGTKVYASEYGIVEKSYYSASYGYNVLINHGNGYKTRYAHLKKLKVYAGEKVGKGDLIGLSGNTGESTGPHLHYEVIKDGKRVNPLNYLK